jgi:Integrase core domain
MRSHSTREFLAGVAIAQQFGRPHTPTDQAWIETLFGHVKGEWPHLEKTRDPGAPDAELDKARREYNGVRLHATIGYVTPTTSTKAKAMPSASSAATGSPPHATTASHTVEPQPTRRTRDRAPSLAGYFSPRLVH